MTPLERYLRFGNLKVQGWLEPFSVRYIAELAKLQEAEEIKGANVEIGVHHGRLFILMHLARPVGQDLAIDVFGDQHLNIDRSGVGDKEIFLQNLIRWGGDPNRVGILQKSSLEVRASEIIDRCGRVALFSVDGGHTAECAYNDLLLADQTLRDDGVVILDDFFNEFWPEVCLGANKYLSGSSARLRPFTITAGKLYLSTAEGAALYRTKMRARFNSFDFDKTVSMWDTPVDIFGISEATRTTYAKLRRRISGSPIGTLIKQFVRK